jgi:uncharacterized protein (DUF2147 family)
MPTDLRGRPQCGLIIITTNRAEPDGSWHGYIADPRDGHSYQTRMSVDQSGDLRLRVFIGIPALGSTQAWHPLIDRLGADCRKA